MTENQGESSLSKSKVKKPIIARHYTGYNYFVEHAKELGIVTPTDVDHGTRLSFYGPMWQELTQELKDFCRDRAKEICIQRGLLVQPEEQLKKIYQQVEALLHKAEELGGHHLLMYPNNKSLRVMATKRADDFLQNKPMLRMQFFAHIVDDDAIPTQRQGGRKEKEAKVQNILNGLYRTYKNNDTLKFPYARYQSGKEDFTVEGLPEGVRVRKTCDLGAIQLNRIIECAHNISIVQIDQQELNANSDNNTANANTDNTTANANTDNNPANANTDNTTANDITDNNTAGANTTANANTDNNTANANTDNNTSNANTDNNTANAYTVNNTANANTDNNTANANTDNTTANAKTTTNSNQGNIPEIIIRQSPTKRNPKRKTEDKTTILAPKPIDQIMNRMKKSKTTEHDTFLVEDILKEKRVKRCLHYLVKWVGYEDPTWEPAKNIPTHLIKAFVKK